MSDINYAALDPGVRGLVRLLNRHGFETTDSGDGVSKAEAIEAGHALPYPHVFIRAEWPVMMGEADRAQALLGDEWKVEAHYCAVDQSAIISVTPSDDRLPPPPGCSRS